MEKLIIGCVVKSSLIALFTALALYIFRVKAARVRHAVWASVVVLMLVLPLWTAWGPKAVLRLMKPEPVTVNSPIVVEMADEDAPVQPIRHSVTWTWENWLAAVYLVGVCALLWRLAIGTIRARRLVMRATNHAGKLTSDSCVAPITVGWLFPTVILPACWTRWSQAQLEAVLAHEGEHVRRRDPLMQWLALVNRSFFWFHPLSWWLSRRLSALAEEACDDAVLAQGHDPLHYSECLLDLARLLRQASAPIDALGMAMPGAFLPQRIRRILAGTPVQRISRGRLACMALVCAAVSAVFTVCAVGYAQADVTAAVQEVATPQAATVALVAPVVAAPTVPRTVLLAQATTPARPAMSVASGSASFIGSVVDPSGAVVPYAAVTLTNADSGSSFSATADNTGTYQFQNIEPGNYKVMLKVPGFKTLTQTGIVVASGEAHNGGKMFLQLGAISESVSVSGSRSVPVTAASPTVGNPLGPVTTLGPMTTLALATTRPGVNAPTAQGSPGGPIAVGGNVQAAKLINAVRPVYPPELLQEGVQGTVRIEAVLTKDGVLSGINLISVDMDPRLTQPALEAVKQWRYKPTLLNGEPVEVITTIDVNFSLTN